MYSTCLVIAFERSTTPTQVIKHDHPPVTEHEIEEILKKILSRRASGEDGIPNEILKLANSLLLPTLRTLLNACLKYGYFPQPWRTATTAILGENDKPDYSEAGTYRPIALWSCLGKILETIVTRRIAHWAERDPPSSSTRPYGRRAPT